MPTKSIALRIDTDLLNCLETRAEKEHRTLSNMVISILLDDSHQSSPCYSVEDIELCFAKIGAFLSSHANDDNTREIYWNFVEFRESCYPIIYPDQFRNG